MTYDQERFDREHQDWQEECRIWAFEQHGFTKPHDSPPSRERGRAPVVPLVRAGARPHLLVLRGGKDAA